MSEKFIPKLYRRQAVDLLLFGFVNGVTEAMPTVSIKDCIILFQERFNVTEDELPMEAARSTYYRMLKESDFICGKEQQGTM